MAETSCNSLSQCSNEPLEYCIIEIIMMFAHADAGRDLCTLLLHGVCMCYQ